MSRSACAGRTLVAAGFVIAAVSAAAQSPEPAEIRIAYIERADDPAYRMPVSYAGVYRKARATPYPAAEMALKDTAAAARVAGLTLVLDRRQLGDGENAAQAVRHLTEGGHLVAAVLDLSLPEVEAAAKELAKDGPILINARHRDDALRFGACRTRLLHTLPSWSMYMDALAQGLTALGWRSVLILQGPSDDDRRIASAFLASTKKFSLRLVATRDFLAGNDPRQRDQTNVRLLTANVDYDVVFIADASGEFARTVPFNTQKPRPVVGSAGLAAHAWHPFWERHGAPQLNRRFAKEAGRAMTDEDWATWIGIRMIATAVIDFRVASGSRLMEAVTSPALRLELYKGVPGSVRPWSLQLRQTMLLATSDAVVGLAPVDGVLHHKNNLDTLGPDEPEFQCS
jgi:ABC transporter substrate binding protein (PQQ-dependent alcohol dehydrogenase system)